MGSWTWFRGGRRSKSRLSKKKEQDHERSKSRLSKKKEQEKKSTEWEPFEALAKANRYEELMQILESTPNDDDDDYDDDINDKSPECGSESGEDNSTEAMSASSPSPSSKNSGTGSEKETDKLEAHMNRMRAWLWECCRRQEVEEVPEMSTTTCTCFPKRRSEQENVQRDAIQVSSDETPLHRIVRFQPPVDVVDSIIKQLQTVHAAEHHVLPDTLVPEEVTDADGRNALHVACAWNAHFTVIQRLVAGTSAIMPALRKDQHGRLPLHYFCCEGTDLHPEEEFFKRTNATKSTSRKSRYLCKSEKQETVNKISQPRQDDIPPLNFTSDEDAKENRWLSIYILILAYPQGAAIADVEGNTPFDLAQQHSCPDRRVTALLSRNSKRHAPPKLVVPTRDDADDEATIAEAVAGLPLEIGVLLKGKQIEISDDDASYNDDVSSLGRDFEMFKPHNPTPLLMPVNQPEPEEEDICPLDAPLVA